MPSNAARFKFTVKIADVCESIGKRVYYGGYREYPVHKVFDCQSSSWNFEFVIGFDGIFDIYIKVQNLREFAFTNCLANLKVSIQQNDGVAKEIKRTSLHFCSSCVFKWQNIICSDDIFNQIKKFIDSNNFLTLIVELTIKDTIFKCDETLQSLSCSTLSKQISAVNVLDLLYYADGCKSKLLEEECLDFIVMNYDDVVEKNEWKMQNISCELVSKIVEAKDSLKSYLLSFYRNIF